MIPANTKHPAAKVLLEETGPYIDSYDGPARIFWGVKDPLIPYRCPRGVEKTPASRHK